MMNSKDYSIELTRFFDKIRFLRHMTQAELTADIISLRQFRRYLTGVYIMPQYVINDFSKRLGFKPEYIVIEFESDKKRETQKLNEFHNYIVTGNLNNADLMLKNNTFKFILDSNNELFFKYSMILFKFYKKQISENIAIKETKDLINYNKILSNDIFSSTEIVILTSLMGYPSFDERNRIVVLLEKYILNPSLVISGHNVANILLCLNYMIEYYGMNKNYDQVINLSHKAIDYAMKTKTFYLLVDFYYFLSLAYFAVGDIKAYEKSLFNCITELYTDKNAHKSRKLTGLIEDDFKINIKGFMIDYIKNRVNQE